MEKHPLPQTPYNWRPDSWRQRPISHQPQWPSQPELTNACETLANLPPLVFAGEIRNLKTQLAQAAQGKAFVLQAGDCAEAFADLRADSIRDKLKVILQMSVILSFSTGVPVVRVGRIAGQFAKPRSSPTEKVGTKELDSFMGNSVNDIEFLDEARLPDPKRLVQAYHQSAATLNLLRAFSQGGFASLSQVHVWNQEFLANSPQGQRYERLADSIDKTLRFSQAIGLSPKDWQARQTEFYTSHEGLLLDYEQALTRQDSLTGDWYDCSAHMVWIGERTRQIDSAHVEFMRGIHNPIGCKIGPKTTPDQVLDLCQTLNPDRQPGRLTLISRLGANNVAKTLPNLLTAVAESGHPVLWQCDPMHGNTYLSENGIKTRNFESIIGELEGYLEAHAKVGTWPGGIHLELTGDDVTECLGGAKEIETKNLPERYQTLCDPRLNASQSLELAFRLADQLSKFAPNHQSPKSL